MTINSDYTPLHLSSCFSFGHGLLTPERICREVKKRGYPAVGLVDRHNFYGLVRFLRAAAREGVKALVGMALLRRGKPLCTAYVLERSGFVTLNRIVSQPQGSDPQQYLLEHGWQGLAVMSGDPSVLLSLQGCSSRELYVQLTYGQPVRELLAFSSSSGLPLLALNQAVFLEQEQIRIGHLLRSISRRCTVDELPDGLRLRPQMRLVNGQEMERYFSAVPEALKSARLLAEQASCDGLLSRGNVFPDYRGLGEERCFRLLRQLCYEGARQRYGSGCASAPGVGLPAKERVSVAAAQEPPWKARLERELRVIRTKGFCGYFLVVREILGTCTRTCGRGSSAASLVSYLLGITHVDPLRYNLDFDRFLNVQREDPPDIDVDFPWDERNEVLRRLFSRYQGRAAMVADHVTFGPRSAMREAATAYGLPEGEIETMVRFFKYGEEARIPPYLLEAARGLRGLPRHLGTHCGGVVITPGPITDYTHVRRSTMGYPVMAWDRESAEGAGLVKIDLLGNRSLAVLRDTVRLARRSLCFPDAGGPAAAAPEADSDSRLCAAAELREQLAVLEGRASPQQVALLQDLETRQMIAAGETVGMFYVESPASRQLLRKLGRGDYEHLVMAGSIIRPAANRTIQEFLRRVHGAPFSSPTPVLSRSYGLMVYQEDIARVTGASAGFSPALADRLRKTLAAGDGCGPLERYRRLFFSGGARRGTARKVLEELWEMICSFRGYSFCKAHSASYALVSFKLAYLKRRFPREFFLAVVNNGGGYYSRQTYLNECRRLGIPLLLPDVNRSEIAYTADGGGIRVGLGQLRSISRSFLGRLLRERLHEGPFSGPEDFFRRLRPGLMETRILVRSGALDGIASGTARPQLLWRYLRRQQEGGLFAPEAPPPSDYPVELKLLDELRTLGLMVSRHPVSLFRPRARQQADQQGWPVLIRSSEIPSRLGEEVSLVGLVASGKEVITRSPATGAPADLMLFVSFEDEDSLFETVLFPAVFRRFRDCIDGGGVLLLSGRAGEEMGAVSVAVRRLARLGAPLAGQQRRPPLGAPPLLA
ncbi:MAG: DNA polymerase III subunit alpha [Spirochaetaceae bacterium]|nr:MAG: DNA polymerase III subunit alpha [Spirochaetaceae bacterium]